MGHPVESLSIPVGVPYEFEPALALLALTAIPGTEIVDLQNAEITRFLLLPSGSPTQVTIRLARVGIEVRHHGLVGDDLDHVVTIVRRWLDLDADPDEIRDALGRDPVIGGRVHARPGLRVISYPDGFEAAVMTVLGQQVSVAAARTFGARAVEAFGDSPCGDLGLRPFPTPAILAAADPVELQRAIGVTNARARCVHGVASACAGGLVIDPDSDGPELRRTLLGLPGIGPWTVDLLAVRALGDRDAYPAGDLVLQRILGVRSASQALEAAEAWSPFRAYALFHLWSSALGI